MKCPKCGKPLKLRSNKKTKDQFYGCSGFPVCRMTLPLSYEEPKKFNPTVEQAEIYKWMEHQLSALDVPGALMVEACAGSGKTHTIGECIKLVPKHYESRYLVFNTDLQIEAYEKGLPAKTTHSEGYSVVKTYCDALSLPKPRVEKNKIRELCIEQMGSNTDRRRFWWMISGTEKIVENFKNNLLEPTQENAIKAMVDLILPEDANEILLANFAIEIFQQSVDRLDMVDFNDMIYLPYYYDIKNTSYDWLFIDEYQDMNRCQLNFTQRVSKNKVVMVGDRNQSIYLFRGAHQHAIQWGIDAFEADTLPLSTTFRCPVEVVEIVNEMFPKIEFNAFSEDHKGSVRKLHMSKFFDSVEEDALVVCRTNAPMVRAVLALVRMNKKAFILGREVHKTIKALIERANGTDVDGMLNSLYEYKRVQSERLIQRKKYNQLELLNDQVETVEVLSQGETEISAVLRRLDQVFTKSKKGVTFSTVHKAKGMENENVYILRPDLMPHPMGQSTPDSQQQELNIMYVAWTRTLKNLTFLEG